MRPLKQPPHHTQVIDRPELAIIERNPKGTRRSIVLIIGLFLLGWMFINALSSGSFNTNWFASRNFTIEGIELRPQTVSGKIFWTVTGKLVNSTKTTESAPDIEVKLVRPDGSVAAQDVIAMREQIVPGQSAIAFRGRIQTEAGEAVTAEVDLVKPGAAPRDGRDL
jgi:hypothetical protein